MAKPEGMKTETWTADKLATLNDPQLWEIHSRAPVREVGCRKCGGRIPKGSEAAQADPRGGTKSMPGWLHYECARQVCQPALTRSEEETRRYREEWDRMAREVRQVDYERNGKRASLRLCARCRKNTERSATIIETRRAEQQRCEMCGEASNA